MQHYLLRRQSSSTKGTLGELLDSDGNHICYTLELPWLDNEPLKSCIPISTYSCIRHDSLAHPHTWEVQNVPGRSGILIHNGNTEKDSLGCIIVGNSIGVINGLPAVLNSNTTLANLQEELPDTFTLAIV